MFLQILKSRYTHGTVSTGERPEEALDSHLWETVTSAQEGNKAKMSFCHVVC